MSLQEQGSWVACECLWRFISEAFMNYRLYLIGASLVLSSSFALAVPAAVQKGQIVAIGCSVPGASNSSATVYSVEKKSASGSNIALPAAVAPSSSCSTAINAMNASTTTCPSSRWVLLSKSPVVLNGPYNGYTLINYVYQCSAL